MSSKKNIKIKKNFIKKVNNYNNPQPQGQVTVEGNYLIVEFTYSAEKVAAIKKIPQARFNPKDKNWKVALNSRRFLEESKYFNPQVLNYNFSTDILQTENLPQEVEEARVRLLANPFKVSEKDIQLIRPEVVIRLSNSQNSLRVYPTFTSKARKILDKIKSTHYLKSEKSYYLQIDKLNSVLTMLRDEKIIFAVEENAGERLQGTASLRQDLLTNKTKATGEDLSLSLLVPYIDFNRDDTSYFGENTFTFIGYTTEQLREVFPDEASFTERKTAAAVFSEDKLFKIIKRKNYFNFNLWFTSDVESYIERRREELSIEQNSDEKIIADSLVGFAAVDICWFRDEEGNQGVIIAKEYYQSNFLKNSTNPLKKYAKELLISTNNYFTFTFREQVVLDIYQEVESYLQKCSLPPAKLSEAFEKFTQELEKRKIQFLSTRRYQILDDLMLEEGIFTSPEHVGKLFPHQRVAIQWLTENKQAFLGDDMGLGKTLTVLSYFDVLKKKNEVDFLLVLCPNSLTRNWKRENENWFPHHNLLLLPDEKSEKIAFFKKLSWGDYKYDGLVINYEAVRLDYVLDGINNNIKDKQVLLCLDESQRVKNSTSKTFTAISSLENSIKRKVFLSGTPTPKDITDIWAQMYLLDGGERFGNNYYKWLEKVAELGNRYSDFAVKKFKIDHVQEAISRVQEILLRRKKEDVINLPEKTFIVRDVELTTEQQKRYDEVRKDLLLRVSSTNGKTFVREINNILEEYLRAVQVASNPRLIDDTWPGEPAKFKELDLMIEEIVKEKEEKVVIWTNYLGNVRELVKRYEEYGAAPFSGEVSTEQRDLTIKQFQNEAKPKILVAVPAAGGVGITLTAAQTAIYLEKTWNAEHWLQSIDRIHRIGQKGTVTIISLHASKVDELIAKNLARKEREQAKLLGDNEKFELEFADYPTREELIEALRD
ncbi:MAG: DEAD/DEAH box helicase [Proteobacteria bacterium]|nr:DEAD/DEAH box helicase [Pseudomonadota bacterium]